MYKVLDDYPLYEINEFGVVRNRNTHYVTSQRMNRNGYLYVQLLHEGKNHMCLVHRLVAETFIPNPDGLPLVNHIDECSVHNSVDNLEWISYKDNSNHGTRNERIIRDRQNPVLSFDEYGVTIRRYPSKREAARDNNVSEISIRTAINKKNKCKGLFWRDDIANESCDEESLNKLWIEESYARKITKRASAGPIPISAFDAEGNLVMSFSSKSAAAKAMDVSCTAIATAVRSGTRCKNYFWRETAKEE